MTTRTTNSFSIGFDVFGEELRTERRKLIFVYDL